MRSVVIGVIFTTVRFLSLFAQQPTAFVGSWQGTLSVGAQTLRAGVIVEQGKGSSLTGTFVSLDQGAIAIPAVVETRGDTFVVTIATISARYVATRDRTREALVGTFTQGPTSQPLTMLRVDKIAVRSGVSASVPQTFPAHLASDADIRALLAKRVDDQRRALGVVVGVIDPTGRRVVSYGHTAKDDPRTVDGKTVFEIGSITKVFTSILLAGMVRNHEVALDDPVAKYLPAGATVPSKDGRQITLADLATHTSGLPRLPTNFAPRDTADPYADYTTARLLDFLSSYSLPRAPGVTYEYSNLGAGVLGVALSHRAGMDYESLLRRRVLEPLHLDDTRIALTPSMQSRFATGYASPNRVAKPWTFQAIAGAGALRSTADDMLSFLAAVLDESKPLGTTVASMTDSRLRRPTVTPNVEVGLAWHVLTTSGHETIFHDGGTAGFRSFIALDRARKVGVVVLSNSGAPEGVTDIGLYLITGGGSLYEAPPVKR